MALDILTPLTQGLQARAMIDSRADAKRRQEQEDQLFARKIREMDLQEMDRQAGIRAGKEKSTYNRWASYGDLLSDPQMAIKQMDKDIANVVQSGGDPTQTIELRTLLASGDTEAANKVISGIRKVGQARGFLDKPKAKKYEQGKGAMEGFAFDPTTGQFLRDETAQQKLAELAKKPKLTLKDKQSINKDITSFTKDAKSIVTTANDLSSLKEIGGGPAAIAGVFKFMKALDPQSVVREGEFATAENSAGVPEAIRNYYNKFASGELLGDEQFENFVMTAQQLANNAVDAAETEVTGYLNTFDTNDFGEKARQRFIDRIPKRFEIVPPSLAKPAEPKQPTNTGFKILSIKG